MHHIEALEKNSERAFDTENLITLCSTHHEAAEAGKVPKEILFKIAKENELRYADGDESIPRLS